MSWQWLVVCATLVCCASSSCPTKEDAFDMLTGYAPAARFIRDRAAELLESSCNVVNAYSSNGGRLVMGSETELTASFDNGESLTASLHIDHRGRIFVHSFLPRVLDSAIQDKPVRLCTYNTWHLTDPYERRLPKMVSLMEHHCDVSFLQEVRTRWSPVNGSLFTIVDMINAYAPFSSSPLWWSFHPAMSYGASDHLDSEGLAVISTVPLTQVVFSRLSRDHSNEEDAHQRGLLHALLPTLGLHVFNTHMSLSLAAQARNAGEIRRAMDASLASDPGAAVLLGDFNCEAWHGFYRRATGDWGMKDAWNETQSNSSGNDGRTFPSWSLAKRIDFVLMEGPIVATSAETFGKPSEKETPASDHLGLMVTLMTSSHHGDEL